MSLKVEEKNIQDFIETYPKYSQKCSPEKFNIDQEIESINNLRSILRKYKTVVSDQEEDKKLLNEGKISDRVMKKLIKHCEENELNFYETFCFHESSYKAGCLDVCNPIVHIKVIFGVHRSSRPYWNEKTFEIENPLCASEYIALRCALALGYSVVALGLAIVVVKTCSDKKQVDDANEIAFSLQKLNKIKNVTAIGEAAKDSADLSSHICVGKASDKYIDAGMKMAEGIAHIGAAVLSHEIPPVSAYEGYQGFKSIKEAFNLVEQGNCIRDWGVRNIQPVEHQINSMLETDTFSYRD